MNYIMAIIIKYDIYPFTQQPSFAIKHKKFPNYFGEIVFWTGVFISGFNIYNSYQFWIFSILGYIGIIYVMFSGARRLEIRQNKTYGNDAEYQNYFNNTPMIFPCIPLYSVERFTWFVA